MKTVIINAGPRKNWNTDLMLKEAQKGAESVGAETEYIDLYSLNFTGCRSCLACKLKGAQRNSTALFSSSPFALKSVERLQYAVMFGPNLSSDFLQTSITSLSLSAKNSETA